MIRPDAIGDLKDGAAGLVALSELFASRRVGPKSVARSLASVVEACSGVERAADLLAADLLAATKAHPEAVEELRALHAHMTSSVRELAVMAESASRAPVDARTRLVLERATQEACGHVVAGLFAGEMIAAAAAPRKVSVHVVDVLSFGPLLPDGPGVVRATLDVPSEPVTTADARLVRALVELCVQIAAGRGIAPPHVEVAGGLASGGARVRVGPPRSPSASRTGARSITLGAGVLTVRKLPWTDGASALVRAAAAMAGAKASVEPGGRATLLDLP